MKISQKQQMFDKVVSHLATQGRRAVDSRGYCTYLAKSGDMCAVGCLLGDQYDESFEDQPVSRIYEHHAGLPYARQVAILRQLQTCHDNADDVESLRHELQSIATQFNLKFDPTVITKWS